MKTKRQNTILEIVEKNSIQTQEELIAKLAELGYRVTQATASRDIRELKLTKATVGGVYQYVLPRAEEKTASLYNNALTSSIRSVKFAQNLVIVKTFPGMAQPFAVFVDNLESSDILGCIAGDDTILIVTPDVMAAENVVENITRAIRH